MQLNIKKSFLLLILLLHHNLAASVQERKISILATIMPVASLIKAVGGERVEVDILQASGDCPHHYHLKPSDLAKIEAAGVIIGISEEFEEYLQPIINKFPRTKIITLTTAQLPRIIIASGKTNWHIWLDLQNSQRIIESIADYLSQLYPNDKDYFAHNAQSAIAKLETLITKQKALYAERKFFIWSDDLAYLEPTSNNDNFLDEPSHLRSGYNFLSYVQNHITPRSDVCIIINSEDYAAQGKKLLRTQKRLVIIEGEKWDSHQSIPLENMYFGQFEHFFSLIETNCHIN